MKTQILNVEGKVRKSTIKFAQALLDAGVKVTKVFSTRLGDGASVNTIHIKGRKRFSAALFINYEEQEIVVDVLKGLDAQSPQSCGICTTHNEFRTLLKVWNIADYAA